MPIQVNDPELEADMTAAAQAMTIPTTKSALMLGIVRTALDTMTPDQLYQWMTAAKTKPAVHSQRKHAR